MRAVPVNERMQIVLHPWTSYVIVPVFALANAGVDLRGGVLGEALRVARDAAGRSGETESHGERRVADLVALARLHEAYGDPALVDAVYLRPPPITRPN